LQQKLKTGKQSQFHSELATYIAVGSPHREKFECESKLNQVKTAMLQRFTLELLLSQVLNHHCTISMVRLNEVQPI